ncbi:MAG: DUF393 domain-containing protein [Nitrosomonas sp.]|nr:MAG: DUF393 domain-containing protein [Nitrosomonas sp.]
MRKQSACETQWHDIHHHHQLINEIGADLAFARKRLHVIDERGELQVGFDAFLAIWRNSPTELWKCRMLGLPVIKQLCRLAYNGFAAALYCWNRLTKRW